MRTGWRKAIVAALALAWCVGHARADDQDKRTERQEHDDKDKKLLAEIAAKPEVQREIDDHWAGVRERDLDQAYDLNTSYRAGEGTLQRQGWGRLYDNPVLQDYVNELGQRLVPRESPHAYAFRLILDPQPQALALSTGSIYLSTGLVSLLDNEAQLAYVLAHEIAHVDRGHHYQQVRNEVLEGKLAEAKQQKAKRKRRLFGVVGALAGTALGSAIGDDNAGLGALLGAAAGATVATLTGRSNFKSTDWEVVHEDEADEAAFRMLLALKFDPREVPKTYVRLERLVTRDARVGLGFMGSPGRVRARLANARRLLEQTLKADVDGQTFLGSSPDFALLMSALKRDNGVIALDFDLFAMARDNLEDALALRSSDPRLLYYLGKVISLSGRGDGDRRAAVEHYLAAIRHDAERGNHPEPHLQHALDLIKQGRPELKAEIQSELKTYVTLYQRQNGGRVPPNMHVIYDYFLLAGDTSWFVPPALVVQTQLVDWPRSATVPAPKRAPARP